ncbi:uncharacterized protein LOC116118313 [Pistacia vera]|uniref:uncharacterized protein LOC116118313 n=1 Tax=Pistacia vera TaxID=55513 RepID=UPI001263E2AB|nr:uncharacterized protein LOC116118313 [Pistacia vera]
MPLPWKKNNTSFKFSRLVAGLHHSPKRGGSLVVETGFPTSLVDLFVKNKDRLKKPSKRKSPPYSPLHSIRSPPPPPPPPPPSPVRRSVSAAGLVVSSLSGFEGTKRNVEDLVVLNECDGGADGDGMMEKGFFAVVLKILMVVAVALSTKKMAVGITMSAFLLFLVEYASSGALVFLKPCSKARTVLDSFVVKIKVLYFPNSELKKDDDELCSHEIQRCNEDSSKGQSIVRSDVCDSCEFVNEIGLKSPGREIHVPDSNCDGEKLDVLIHKKERSRSAKIRRKFVKNFVPKKLRDAKKEWKNKEKEKEREKEKEKEKESESNSEIGLACLRDEKLEKILGEEQDHVFGNSQAEADVGEVEEIVERERKGNSRYFSILLLIVLGGLVGGRVVALLCTLGWCLMLKLVGKWRFS